ncbi:hypothetical protein AK85_04910 [Streptococcus pneumoniae B1598]|nr:hypothetical protein AK85_04910 [Streptococcus pneumoniae B1598]
MTVAANGTLSAEQINAAVTAPKKVSGGCGRSLEASSSKAATQRFQLQLPMRMAQQKPFSVGSNTLNR